MEGDMLIAGIDPGKDGGVAFYDTKDGSGYGEHVDTSDAVTVLEVLAACRPQHVGIEVPTGRPPKTGGWQQISGQWLAIGVPLGVVAAMLLPVLRITPAIWQRAAFRGHAKPTDYAARKKLALRLARERWPMASLARVKDSGIADALWIAWATSRYLAWEEVA